MSIFKISIFKEISKTSPYSKGESTVIAEAEFATKKEALAQKKEWVKKYGLEKYSNHLINFKTGHEYSQNF
jgi:hypothetical protein